MKAEMQMKRTDLTEKSACFLFGIHDSSVGVMNRTRNWRRKDCVSSPAEEIFMFSKRLQTGAHTVSYSMGTGGSFPSGKVVVVWSWPLTPI
jgi:hypothetical protein